MAATANTDKTELGTPTEASSSFNKVASTPARTPFVRRGFRQNEANPTVTFVEDDDVNLGAIERLPLSIQIGFRRKLLRIIALQLSVVLVALAGVQHGSSSIREWFNDTVLSSTAAVILAIAVLFLSLLGLHYARSKHPLNWVLLGLLTVSEIVCLLCIDIGLDSPLALFNLVFAWFCVVVMLLGAGITTSGHDHWWNGLSGQRTAESTDQGRLVPPFVAGLAALVVSWVVVAVLSQTSSAVPLSKVELGVSVPLVLVVCGWLMHQITVMPRTMTPDDYMLGVIYLYANIITAIGAVIAGIVCFAACGPEVTTLMAAEAVTATDNTRRADQV